eukprot:CAMPEP_0114351578 /NCGR_PEP_ID=MMETSP0101-20121206/17304_1 /TAXON_ID=38822 ORGANISM="Pteridomonas danica, Strain PT" /NCGR_SAMPLE_ID=MMETSP0101 /ASSEMBLY_ACC=CAM_ASM_000211 /LENGTH=319 /DNA_ID=CAMNT_0001491555 /DNA_START=84 /DNA_END=1040 /DNA_ORIENTATION=+
MATAAAEEEKVILQVESCPNISCKCPDCTCGASCTCGISNEVSCDPCDEFKSKMKEKMKANVKPSDEIHGGLKILCIGGTGRLGLVFIENALLDGHIVTAVVRSSPQIPNTLSSNQTIIGTGASSEVLSSNSEDNQKDKTILPHSEIIQHKNLTVIQNDIKNVDEMTILMQGHDIIVVTLGAWPKENDEKPFTLHQDAAKAYAPAMKTCGIKRLFVCFGMGLLFPRKEDNDRSSPDNVFSILQKDMFKAYDIMNEFNLDYSIWCPGDFPHGPRNNQYIESVGKAPDNMHASVTTGMVADSMCKELIANKFIKQKIGIAP